MVAPLNLYCSPREVEGVDKVFHDSVIHRGSN